MRKYLLATIIGVLILSCYSAKIKGNPIKYFDENNIEVSSSKFNQIRLAKELIEIAGDSVNHRKLTVRENRGKISGRKTLEFYLEKETGQKIDSTKPIIIIYYPGKDSCNSSGTANKKWIQNWYNQLEDGLNQIAQIKPFYIYKNSEGLKKYNGILNWHKDPEGAFERLFFKHHYPCSSFVVISKNGNYISYFGEFSKEYVWEATQLMNE